MRSGRSTPIVSILNRGWENQPNSRGLYTHYKDSLLKVGFFPSPMKAHRLIVTFVEIMLDCSNPKAGAHLLKKAHGACSFLS